MIEVREIGNNNKIYINPDKIGYLEGRPTGTIVIFTGGEVWKTITVRDSIETLALKINQDRDEG